MKITQVEAIPLFASFADALDEVPTELSHPAYGMRVNPLLGQGAVIVRVTTDEGLIGIGEAMGRPGPRATAATINDVLTPMLLGQDPRHHHALWSAMFEELRFAPMGISGVDIALWDLRGKIYGDFPAEPAGRTHSRGGRLLRQPDTLYGNAGSVGEQGG